MAPLGPAAHAAGVRIIAPDRPGCGGSTPTSALTFGSYADDLRQLLDALGLPLVTLAGASAGGGFALAAAARLPGRVARLVLVCAMASTPPPDALRNQPPSLRRSMAIARRFPRLAAAVLTRMSRSSTDGAKLEKQLRFMPESDKRIIRAQVATGDFQADQQEATRQGGAAAIREMQMYGRASDVPLSDVTVPTVLLHGADDVNVPVDVARWLAASLQSAELVEVPDAGHLFLFDSPQLLLDRVV
jgi:pimeloyl-ACP methyl ester carboxylesterase